MGDQRGADRIEALGGADRIEALGRADRIEALGRADRIEVRGLELLVFCGVLAEEQARKQPFLFDLDLYLDLEPAGQSDDLSQTANYGLIIDVLASKLPDERFQLLERMSARVAELVFEHCNAEAVTVTARKLRPPVAAHVDTTGVRIHRVRS